MNRVYTILIWLGMFVYVSVMSYYIIDSQVNKPLKEVYLVDAEDQLYYPQDLTKHKLTDGQIKQMITDVVKESFSINYVNYIEDEEYSELIKNKRQKLNPDHRDKIQPFFTPTAHEAFFAELEKQDWHRGFWIDRKKVKILLATPPYAKESPKVKEVNGKNRLESQYFGVFYLSVSQSGVTFSKRYRYVFQVSVIRDDSVSRNQNRYYYPPLIQNNRTGYKINEFTFKVSS